MAGSAPLRCSTLEQTTATPQQLQSEFELGSQTAPQTAPVETGCAFRLSRSQPAMHHKTACVTGLFTAQLACEHHCLQPCTACKEGTCQRPQMECCDAFIFMVHRHCGSKRQQSPSCYAWVGQPGISSRLPVLVSTEKLPSSQHLSTECSIALKAGIPTPERHTSRTMWMSHAAN